jgi:hypothetical protein
MNRTVLFPLIMEDVTNRVQLGTQKYGEPLTTFNNRNMLVDAYEEALDKLFYLKGAVIEDVERRARYNEILLDISRIVFDIALLFNDLNRSIRLGRVPHLSDNVIAGMSYPIGVVDEIQGKLWEIQNKLYDLYNYVESNISVEGSTEQRNSGSGS